MPIQGANVYDILRKETLVLTKEAAESLTDRLTTKETSNNKGKNISSLKDSQKEATPKKSYSKKGFSKKSYSKKLLQKR